MSEDVKVIIKSDADISGIDKTKAALDGVTPASQRTAAAGQSAEASFRGVNAAAAASSGTISGVAQAMAALLPKFAAMQAALPVIGLATAAFASWKMVIDTLIAQHAALAKSMRDIHAGNAEANVNSLAQAYGRMTRELTNAADQADRMLTAERNMASAQKDRELANIGLAEAKALQGVDDPLMRQKITSDANVRRSQVEQQFGSKDSALEDKALKQQAATLETSIAADKAQQAALRASLSQENTNFANLKKQQEAARDKALTPGGKEAATAKYNPELERSVKTQQAIADQFKALTDKIDKSQAALDTNRAAREVLPVRSAAAAAMSETGALTAKEEQRTNAQAIAAREAEAAAIRAKEKQLADLQLARDAEQKKLSDAAQTEAGARGAHTSADTNLAGARTRASKLHQGKDAERRLLAPYEKADKAAESLERAASQNMAAVQAASTANLKNINDQLSTLARELASQKNQKSTARMDSGVE
jgi:hypothetical protein